MKVKHLKVDDCLYCISFHVFCYNKKWWRVFFYTVHCAVLFHLFKSHLHICFFKVLLKILICLLQHVNLIHFCPFSLPFLLKLWYHILMFCFHDFYIGYFRRNFPHFRRTFLSLNYINITKNTYIHSSMFMQIMGW